jgi:hypothetical protein
LSTAPRFACFSLALPASVSIGKPTTPLSQLSPKFAASIREVSPLTSARIRGRMTWLDGFRSIVLQDSEGGIIVEHPNVEVELKIG